MLKPSFRQVLDSSTRPCVGLWNSSASPVAMEILAMSGADFIVIDGEHGPIELREILALLQACEPYPATAVVRVPWNDEVRIKQVLDLGAQNLVVPMVSSASEAQRAVEATRYPSPHRPGRRGMGAMLARSARWGAVTDYSDSADSTVSLTVQIETAQGVRNVEEIIATEGVAALFVGPADLAAHMGHVGDSSHAEVVEAVDHVVSVAVAAGIPVGVNALSPRDADRVLDAGADFVVTSADVLLIAQGAQEQVARIRARDSRS